MSPALSPHELVVLADANFAECVREHARWTDEGVIEERAGTLRTASATRFPAGMFNTALCTGPTPGDPATWLEAQLAHYAQAQRGFTVYTRGVLDRALADACVHAGLIAAGTPPGMACEAPVAEPALDARYTHELVQSPGVLRDWIDVQAKAYVSLGLPERAVLEIMQTPECMLAPHALFVLGRYDGAPATGAMVLFSHGIAGVYWVGVRPELRRRGLGEAITRTITNAAFARGARAVILQASPMGLPVYQSLGYREITSYPWFVVPRSRVSPGR